MTSLRQFKQSTSRIIAVISLVFSFPLAIPLAAGVSGSVTLAWDPNTETDVIGYRVHYGSESGAYTEVIDVGPVTAFEITGLLEEQGYYCSVTAYNIDGVESDFAEEVFTRTKQGSDSPTIGQEFRINRMTLGADHMVTFEVSGMVGDVVEVWASPDLVGWTCIDTLTGVSGPITIQDPAAAGQPRRFYRLSTP